MINTVHGACRDIDLGVVAARLLRISHQIQYNRQSHAIKTKLLVVTNG